MKMEDIKNPKMKRMVEDALRKEASAKSNNTSKVSDLELGDKHTTKRNGKKSKAGRDILLSGKEHVQAPYIQVPVIIIATFFCKRLPDVDGCIVKWILDALVTSGVLKDDRQEFVKEVKQRYVKVKTDAEERCVLEVYEDKDAEYQKELQI